MMENQKQIKGQPMQYFKPKMVYNEEDAQSDFLAESSLDQGGFTSSRTAGQLDASKR
jgi:hypothetical protein